MKGKVVTSEDIFGSPDGGEDCKGKHCDCYYDKLPCHWCLEQNLSAKRPKHTKRGNG